MTGLSSEPELHTFFLGDDDEFLIVACDGLWETFTCDGAVTFARSAYAPHRTAPHRHST